MQVKAGESQQDIVKSGTFNGITVAAEMLHTTTNTAFATSDFKPQYVNLKVILKRANEVHIILQDNLQLLGTFNTLERGYDEYFNGIDLVSPASGKYAKKIRSVFINFGGCLRISNGDELIVECTPADNCFTSNVSVSSSRLDVRLNPAIGYELYIPQTMSAVVSTSTTQQSHNPGDNILRLAYLNLDKNDLETPVLSTLNITSDRWQKQGTFNQLHAEKHLMQPSFGRSRYGTSLPIGSGAPTVMKGHDYLPQSLLLFNAESMDSELDQCRIDASYDGSQVASSQNYYCWITFKTSIAQLVEAENRENKHVAEKLQDVKAKEA